MNAFSRLDNWPTWRKILVIAALMAPVMLWVLLTNGRAVPFVPPEVLSLLFLPVAAYGFGVCALGGYWLGGRVRWLLVPLLAMGIELAFAIPMTLADPTGGETPFSVVLEAPFWTGAPALVGAMLGAAARWFQEREAAVRGAGPSRRHV